jgi:ADP-heptose:LPS heptosyltransferase
MEKNKMKILVVSLAGIGDSLMSLKVIKELKKKYPRAQIDAFVMWQAGKEILESQKERIGLNKVYQINMFEKRFFKSVKFCLMLRKNKYDLIINLAPQARIHYDIVSFLIGGKKRTGFRYEERLFHKLYKIFLLHKTKKFNYEEHIIKQNLSLIEAETKGGYDFILPEKIKEKTRRELQKIKGKKIGIHIGSGPTKNLYLKRWPIEKWEELIKELLEDKKNNILLFGKHELQENIELKRKIQNPRVYILNKENLIETMGLINECDLFISSDSLLMHIASIFNKKQIILAGPALNKTIMPSGKNKVILSLDLSCQPCYKYGQYLKCKNKEKMKCIRGVTVEQVKKVVEKLI